MASISVCAAVFLSYVLLIISLSYPDSSLHSLSGVLAPASDLCSNTLVANILMRYSTDFCLSRKTDLVSNGRRRTEISGAQYCRFFDSAKLLTAAQRITYVTGRRIF